MFHLRSACIQLFFERLVSHQSAYRVEDGTIAMVTIKQSNSTLPRLCLFLLGLLSLSLQLSSLLSDTSISGLGSQFSQLFVRSLLA